MNRVKELQKDAKFATWEKFKQVIKELKRYKFEKDQLIEHIRIVYDRES